MITLNQFVNGIEKYIDTEFLTKIQGWQKWTFGASISLMFQKSADIFNEIKQNQFIQKMEIITKDDEIDIDKLYKVFLEQSKKSAITFEIPFANTVTLTIKDVEKIYSYIKK